MNGQLDYDLIKQGTYTTQKGDRIGSHLATFVGVDFMAKAPPPALKALFPMKDTPLEERD